MMVLSFQVILNLKVMTLQKNGYSQIQTDLFNHNTICFEVKSFTFITKGGSENWVKTLALGKWLLCYELLNPSIQK